DEIAVGHLAAVADAPHLDVRARNDIDIVLWNATSERGFHCPVSVLDVAGPEYAAMLHRHVGLDCCAARCRLEESMEGSVRCMYTPGVPSFGALGRADARDSVWSAGRSGLQNEAIGRCAAGAMARRQESRARGPPAAGSAHHLDPAKPPSALCGSLLWCR